ncbi:hypothetical protein P3T73_07220 [Kiritimatiellota bacterium B12222]|nr:hypothetical protein P3T73_07220 [Kiritimatiellota bacterium B12222]
MSKKQLEHLRLAPALLACITLLCFPAGIPFPGWRDLLPALITGCLALSIAHTLLKLGRIPAIMRIGVLLPLAFSMPLILRVLPHPFTVLWLLLPFAFILLRIRHRLKTLPAFPQILCFVLCLSLGALALLHLLHHQPNDGLPSLPFHRYIYLSILAIIPLGLATRSVLRPFAKAITRYQILIGLVLVGLYPVIWSVCTASKLPGESQRALHQLSPLPRFFTVPTLGSQEIYPSELRNHPQRSDLLFALNEMTWRLSDPYILSTFPADGELPPEQMLRAMKLYGFLMEDVHGPFLPDSAFTQPAPPEMDAQYVTAFRQSMDQMVYTPLELAKARNLSLNEARAIFQEMYKLNWVRKIPGGQEKYRLTPQARKPFDNGLYPRQLILIDQADDVSVEIDQQLYGERRQLGYHQRKRELAQLVNLGAAASKQVWQYNQHASFFFDEALWKYTGFYLLSLLLALLMGRHLPTQISKGALALLTATGALLIIQLPLPLYLLSALRILIGLWIARNLYALNNDESDRLCLFATALFFSAVLMPLPSSSLLIHQCLWALIWFLPSLGLLFFATRPIPTLLKG